jgi:hypothetical protein
LSVILAVKDRFNPTMEGLSLQRPQLEFIENFLQPDQLQRMLIYFSKQAPIDASYTFTDIIVRLINDPLCIVFGHHGIYLFSNFLIVLPYGELDAQQVAYITTFLRWHVPSLPVSAYPGSSVPSMNIDVRISKQMGGSFSVRPVQLTNIRLSAEVVLQALVKGIMLGDSKHSTQFRTHAINLVLQRVLTRVNVSRSELHKVNLEIDACVSMQTAKVASCQIIEGTCV